MTLGPTSGSKFVDVGGAQAYALNRHGPDGALLLDPYFTGYIDHLVPNKCTIDVGGGAAPWAIHAVEAGAESVFLVDNSEPMLDQAAKALESQPDDVRNKVILKQADAQQLPSSSQQFDIALSINVGCTMPSVIRGEHDALGHWRTPFLAHFQEMARVLKPGGFAIVTAPTSLDAPFTTFGYENDKIRDLEGTLEDLVGADVADMRRVVGEHNDILRATIVPDGPKWRLIKSAGEIAVGQFIWRKLPGLVVPNYNHTVAEYKHTIGQSGFDVRDVAAPLVFDVVDAARADLGKIYTRNRAFHTFLLENPAMIAV